MAEKPANLEPPSPLPFLPSNMCNGWSGATARAGAMVVATDRPFRMHVIGIIICSEWIEPTL